MTRARLLANGWTPTILVVNMGTFAQPKPSWTRFMYWTAWAPPRNK